MENNEKLKQAQISLGKLKTDRTNLFDIQEGELICKDILQVRKIDIEIAELKLEFPELTFGDDL